MSADAISCVESIAIQPRDSFVCPTWCAVDHTDSQLSEWEYGQWVVMHVGKEILWLTSHGTTMGVQLVWGEIVGSSPRLTADVVPEHEVGPLIEFVGDDGSGYMATHEAVAVDVDKWVAALSELGKQATA